jgi:hypothetical protein
MRNSNLFKGKNGLAAEYSYNNRFFGRIFCGVPQKTGLCGAPRFRAPAPSLRNVPFLRAVACFATPPIPCARTVKPLRGSGYANGSPWLRAPMNCIFVALGSGARRGSWERITRSTFRVADRAPPMNCIFVALGSGARRGGWERITRSTFRVADRVPIPSAAFICAGLRCKMAESLVG